MDAGIIVAIVIASLNGLGLIITLVVLILKGGFQQGRLVSQVEGLTAQVAALTTAVGSLQAEVQQTNRVVTALANHTHDVDGNTVFQMPPAAGR